MVTFDVRDRYERFMRPPHPRWVDRDEVPIRQIFVHHWVGWYGLPRPATHGEELTSIDALAEDHLNRLGIGPGYNYVAMPSGNSYYVGDIALSRRHTSNRNPATGEEYNYDSVAISVPGNWNLAEPHGSLVGALIDLLEELRKHPDVSPTVRIMGHRDVYSTGCPGDNLYDLIPMLIRESAPEEDEMSEERMHRIAREEAEAVALKMIEDGVIFDPRIREVMQNRITVAYDAWAEVRDLADVLPLTPEQRLRLKAAAGQALKAWNPEDVPESNELEDMLR